MTFIPEATSCYISKYILLPLSSLSTWDFSFGIQDILDKENRTRTWESTLWPILFLYLINHVIACPFLRIILSLEVKWSEVTQSCLTLCDPVDWSLPGSSIHGIFQARVLEWVAISFSRGSSWPRDRTRVSHIAGRCFTIWTTPNGCLALPVIHNLRCEMPVLIFCQASPPLDSKSTSLS